MTRGSRARNVYMGFDIESGEPGTPRARYSVAVVDDSGALLDKTSGASLSRLIRMAWEYRPVAIGTDNVYELGRDADAVVRIMGLLPPETTIVQVNIIDGRVLDLRDTIRRTGIDLDQQKLTPSRTAYILAVLASRGVGTPVYVQEEKTVITVSRGRWSRSGGMSQSRYQRRIRASVLQAAKRVKESLERAGLDFDVYYRRGKGGLDKAVFSVYAPRKKLVGVVRPHRGVDYTITVKTLYKKAITLGDQPLHPTRPVIVGVDPGVRSGIAILDLDGNVLHVASGKEFDRRSMVETIATYGRPVVIAVDTPEVPEAVKSVAAKFSAQLFRPSKPMPVPEKAELARSALQGTPPSDPHVRDALAAAYKAYISLLSKLRQVESYVAKIDVDIDIDAVKEAVLRGQSVAEAVEKELQRILGEGQPKATAQRQIQQALHLKTLEEEVRSLRERVNELSARLLMAEERASVIQAELERAKVELEQCRRAKRRIRVQDYSVYVTRVKSLEERIEELKRDNENLRMLLEEALNEITAVSRGYRIVVRSFPSLTVSSIRKSERSYGPLQEGEVVYVKNPGAYENDALDEIKRRGVLALLVDEVGKGITQAAAKREIPTLRISEYDPKEVEGVITVDSRVVEDARRLYEDMMRKRLSSIRLEELIEEYRRQRREQLERLKRKEESHTD